MDSGQKILIFTILGALLAGAIVMVFKSNYRPEYLLKTNKTYYPAVEVLSQDDSGFEDKLSADE